MLAELRLNLRLGAIRRRERRALAALGAAAASAGADGGGAMARILARIQERNLRQNELRVAIGASREADRSHFLTVSPWMRPLVVLRGLCSRAVLRHQMALGNRNLTALHVKLGIVVSWRDEDEGNLPPHLLGAVTDARFNLGAITRLRSRRLAPYGGSALPKWLGPMRRVSAGLSRAFWLQLKPNVLPRSSALAGLAAGWWVAETYTDSHFRSALHSLGIGHGGRRVVSGETYRAMLFWLPIFAAALCAYGADRARHIVHRRYIGQGRGS